MIRSTVLLLLFCTVSPYIYGQRVLSKTLVGKHGHFFHIDAGKAFKVNLNTVKSQQITVEAVAEGAYENALVLNLFEKGTEVYIGIEFHPDYKAKNDKLEAHKVLSVAMNISIPESCSVMLEGNSAYFGIQGTYSRLKVVLDAGRCDLNKPYGEIDVVTISGDIWLTADRGIVHLDSEYGEINAQEIPTGNAEYSLKSTSGNIYIVKTL